MLFYDMSLNKPDQQGNILFLILIGVVLFAALSFAFIHSSKTSLSGPQSEKAEISAASIIEFTTSVQNAAHRLIIVNTVPITSLKFNNNIFKTKSGTAIMGSLGSPSDPSLYVFHPKGGSISPVSFANIASACPSCSSSSTSPGHSVLYWENVQENGSSIADPSILVHDLPNDICLALNKKFDISIIPTLNMNGVDFGGTTSIPPSVSNPSGNATSLAAIKGKSSFCFRQDPSNRLIFLHSLQIN